ncbi:MAG: hypothetical protein IJW59_03645 [Clostridia bacterium]|nr:hypothetical protein [Clostridia bacterium]
MEKIGVIEIKTTSVKLSIVEVIRNKYFEVGRTIDMPINLTKDFYSDMFIKPAVIKDISAILAVYKKIIEENECTETVCLATEIISEAKNQNGFINELAVVSGFKFEVLTAEEEINSIYTSVINSFNRPKGVIVNIGDYTTKIIAYNRRNILASLVVPYGSIKLYDELKDKSFEERQEFVNEVFGKMISESEFKNQLPEEYDIIGTGEVFKDFGSVCRKAKKYPMELIHNFEANKTDFDKVYSLIKTNVVGTSTKIKGISLQNSKYFPMGLQIMSAVLSNFENEEFVISKLNEVDGILFNKVIALTLEKPISDTLGYSLQMINDFYDRKPNNSQHIYEISMVLFKQLKVLHKLPRPYVRVLRIASYLSNAGYRVNVENAEKVVFDIIKNSTIFGVAQTDIVLAGFVALCKNSDNFNLSEWVRFKEYLTEEDLVAVKKLAVILKIAEALDVTGFGCVKDISCDILGDSVIMKTIVEGDASFEINYTMLCGSDFKKAFGKNLEVL